MVSGISRGRVTKGKLNKYVSSFLFHILIHILTKHFDRITGRRSMLMLTFYTSKVGATKVDESAVV